MTDPTADPAGADPSSDIVILTEEVEVSEAIADAVDTATDEPLLAEALDLDSLSALARPSVGLGAATGRRKEAVARVRLVAGTGKWTVNGRSLAAYFPNKVHQQIVNEPFVTLDRAGAYDVLARLHGGGSSGQAGALRLGVARALIELDPDNRGPLKKAGFLTRDARVKERKKYGLKKARKAPQYSKR